VVVLGKTGPGLWALGLASAFPLFVHLVLSALAFAGIWSPDFYSHQNLSGLYAEISRWLQGDFVSGNFHSPIAERFQGVEVMHGNAGYASSVAIAIFMAIFLESRHHLRSARSLWSLLATGLCFLSIVIFKSRGALLFACVIASAACILHYGRTVRAQQSNRHSPGERSGRRPVLLVLSLFFAIGCAMYWSVRHDDRWAPMLDKVAAGFSVKDPVSALCQGLSPEDEARLRERLAGRSEDYIKEVKSGLEGQDGGRVVLMRAGMQMAGEHPLGTDGSRQSYERLMGLRCGGRPVLHFAHTHNSWIDLSLALGWAGATLFSGPFYFFSVLRCVSDIPLWVEQQALRWP